MSDFIAHDKKADKIIPKLTKINIITDLQLLKVKAIKSKILASYFLIAWCKTFATNFKVVSQ